MSDEEPKASNTVNTDSSNAVKKTEEEKKEEEKILNPSVAIGAFNGSVLLYYIVRYFLYDRKMEKNKWIFIGATLTVVAGVITQQFFLYKSLSRAAHNGNDNPVASFTAALITNILYIGSVMILLYFLPGFKEPFSNTFGYLIVYIFGVKYAMNRILLSTDEGGDIVKRVYQNPSVLINLITTKNFNKVMDKLQKGNPPIIDPLPEDLKKLYKLVALKDMIGEWIWIMLAGALAISTGYNMIISLNLMEIK